MSTRRETGNRVGLHKQLKESKHIYIQSNDPRFNYGFHKEDDIKEFNKTPEVINLAQYDYSFIRQDDDDRKLPDLISTTELASFQNLEDMEEFYRQKNPKKKLPVGMSVAYGDYTLEFD